ncbi:MAG: molybdopterin-dependent oxidoreductase [Desulfobacterales bacterium]
MRIVTACSQDCPDACSLLVERGEDGGARIRGNPGHPFTRGFCCAKLKSWERRLNSPSRLRTPLRRTPEGLRAVGWEEALDLAAARIQALRGRPETILHLDSSGCCGVSLHIVQHFFNALGASRAGGSLCAEAGRAASIADFGALDHNRPEDLLNAGWIVNWGRDIARTSIHLLSLVQRARKRGARVLTVSPGGDGHEAWSDEFIRIRPGQDRFLAAAVLRALESAGRVFPALPVHAVGWGSFRRILREGDADSWRETAGISAAYVDRLAGIYGGTDGPVSTIIGWGLQRYRRGGGNVRFIDALAVASGQVGRPGAGVYYIVSSARFLDLSWKASPRAGRMARFFKPTIGRDIAAADPPVELVWVNGSNPVNQSPDAQAVARALRQVPFKIVVDAFLTDTAELADLVLPCTLNLEQENLIPSFFHDFLNYARPAFSPPEGARPDSWIVAEVGRRLSPPVEVPSVEEAIRRSLPGGEKSFAELREKGFLEVKRTEIAWEGMRFGHPDGKYRFPAEAPGEDPSAPPEYPLTLLTLVRKEATHSQILPEEQRGPLRAYLSPESPAWAEFDLQKPVFLASPLGRIPVTVEPLKGLHPMAVVVRRGGWMRLGFGVNRLIADAATDLGPNAAFYSQPVRLEN